MSSCITESSPPTRGVNIINKKTDLFSATSTVTLKSAMVKLARASSYRCNQRSDPQDTAMFKAVHSGVRLKECEDVKRRREGGRQGERQYALRVASMMNDADVEHNFYSVR